MSDPKKSDTVPPPVTSAEPDRELEQRLKKNPDNLDAKVDVGSDESMDASDPMSVVQPENNEPAPSSGFDEARESKP